MNEQTILAVDEAGNFTGEYIKKSVGHSGEDKRHLAISVLLENSKGEVLLQKRKHQVFDNIWDVTGATHPLHLKNGHDETIEEATLRCLKREYGIRNVGLKNLGYFNYFAKDGENCENEHCAILVGKYDGELELNPEVGYGYKLMDKKKFLEDIEKNPDLYTAWAREAVKVLRKARFFNG